MKFKRKVIRTLKVQPDVLEKKIEKYLTDNLYRIIERGAGYITFVEDEFSERRRSRSDFYARIGDGKFIFDYTAEKDETSAQLIYFTSLSYYFMIVVPLSAFCIYAKNIVMSIVFSAFFALPILFRVIYLNNVFVDIMEC